MGTQSAGHFLLVRKTNWFDTIFPYSHCQHDLDLFEYYKERHVCLRVCQIMRLPGIRETTTEADESEMSNPSSGEDVSSAHDILDCVMNDSTSLPSDSLSSLE